MQAAIEQMQVNITVDIPKAMSEENNQNSQLLIIIILVKLTIFCAFKIVNLCRKVYKKHNEVVLKKNLTKYIDAEVETQPSTSENSRGQK